MTQRTTAVRIASPCAESWAAMTPTATGRHCAACQKTVVDFTLKTDAEILAALRQVAGGTCGRLRADQLGRPLASPTPAPRWRAWLGAALALGGVLGASRAAAQVQDSYYAGPRPAASPVGSTVAPEPSQPASAPTPTLPADGPVVLRGTVRDAARHEPLPGVVILLKNTTSATVTNAAGEFELRIPPSPQTATLTISSVGYVSQEKTLDLGSGAPLRAELEMDTMMLGGLDVVIDYKRPWPWHPRRFFNWSKYWLTRPFASR